MYKRVIPLLILLLLLVTPELECKRSRGRSKGGGGGSSTHYTRNKPKQPEQQPQHYDPVRLSYANAHKNDKPNAQPKPSAPVEHKPPVQDHSVKQQAPVQNSAPKPSAPVENKPVQEHNVKQQTHVENAAAKPSAPVQEQNVKQQAPVQSSENANQRPIGWNVGNNPSQATGANQQHGASLPQQPPAYQTHATSNQQAPSGYQQGPPGYHQSAPGYHQGPPGYQQGPPGYQQGPPGYHQGPPGYHQNPSYGGQPPYGGPPPYSPPGYHQPGYPQGYGGYGGYGGGFGGYGHGFGGYGNSFANPFAYGMGNYRKSSGGFFGKHAFRNVLAGLLIWNLVRGFTSTPYHIYSFDHRPPDLPQNIPLPANAIILCDDNATSICAPNTYALCTSNNTIMCVASVVGTAPCGGNGSVPCVSSTVPCLNETDPACANSTSGTNTTTISIPCLANVTVTGKIDIPDSAKDNSTSYSATIQLFNNSTALNQKEAVFCVTTLALPEPNATIAEPPPAVPCYSGDGTMVPSNGTEPCVSGVMPLVTISTVSALNVTEVATTSTASPTT